MNSTTQTLPKLKLRFYTSWDVCNYHCEYCVLEQPYEESASSSLPIITRLGNNLANPGVAAGKLIQLAKNPSKFLNPDKHKKPVEWNEELYLKAIDRFAELPYLLNVRVAVGGETFTNKCINEGARRLSNHANTEAVNLITNLSFGYDRYAKIFEGFDLSKIAMVCSYHPTEIRNKELWMETITRLNKEVDIAVVLVAWPPLMDQLADNYKMLTDAGLEVFIQAFNGWHEDRKYPEAYSDEDRGLLKSVFYSEHDYGHMVDLKQPGSCWAGVDYAYVDINGDVFRCGTYQVPIGNIYTGFKLNTGPEPCPGKECWCDTENLNTVEFHDKYEVVGLNQHKYRDKQPSV